MRDWWRRTTAREVARMRTEGRAAAHLTVRITVAAVASYVVGTLVFPGTQPLLAPLTAMLVVQVTPVSLLASGLDRVVAVVAGVSVAVTFAAIVPLEWWSLGVLILVSITIGQLLHLRSNLLEVAISAMLVLGVGSLGAESAAWQRIAETLVGAAVGVAVNLLVPPKVATADAGRAIEGLADSVSDLLRRAAHELTSLAGDPRHDLLPAARGWLDDARLITHDIPQVGAALLHAEQSRRLNVRAAVTPDVGPGLRQGLEALEHSAVAIRSMFRAVVDAADGDWVDEDGAEDVLLGLAYTLGELADGVDTFGQLVRHEAEPGSPMRSADVDALRQALEGMHEARARLEDAVVSGGSSSLLELHAVLLTTVKRLLREMDLDERIRRQVRLRRPQRSWRVHPAGRRSLAQPPESAEPSPEAETQVLPVVPPGPGDRRGPTSDPEH
jgi:hypothetical protein